MKNNQMLSNVILPKKEWGEIDLTDIQDSTVLSIPLEHIFEASFAKHLRDLSKASGVSVDYLLLSLLVITSVIIGNKRSIHVRNGWTDEPAHLWGALVGNPSTRKTVSIRIMQKAIKNLTMARTSEYKQQKKEYDKVLKEYNSGRLHEEPKKPILRQGFGLRIGFLNERRRRN